MWNYKYGNRIFVENMQNNRQSTNIVIWYRETTSANVTIQLYVRWLKAYSRPCVHPEISAVDSVFREKYCCRLTQSDAILFTTIIIREHTNTNTVVPRLAAPNTNYCLQRTMLLVAILTQATRGQANARNINANRVDHSRTWYQFATKTYE